MTTGREGSGGRLHLYVALGGGSGAVLRYAASLWSPAGIEPILPWATLFVNVVGSALLGVLLGRFARSAGSESVRAGLATGFCGGFTTFSTFSAETVLMWGSGRPLAAVLYVGLSTSLSIAALVVGMGALRFAHPAAAAD